jgi:hypothetical protein
LFLNFEDLYSYIESKNSMIIIDNNPTNDVCPEKKYTGSILFM